MHEFIARHQEQIVGVLSGFDRLVFRGTLRPIAYADGLKRYLRVTHVLLKDFGRHVEEVSDRLKEASVAQARALGRPVTYLPSSQTDKDALARRIMAADGITRGLVGVLSCVEPCQSFEIRRDRDTQQLAVEARHRKCLFLYHYWVHPVLGFMNARIQTWFPFAIQVCLNGREWLARQLEATGLRYVRQDNCFPWIEDWAEGPAPAGSPGEGLLAEAARWHCPATESHPRAARSGLPAPLLLVDVSERVGHGPRVPRRGDVAPAVPPAAPPRRDHLRQRRRDAVLGPAPAPERDRSDPLCRRSGERPQTAGGRHPHQAQRERQRGQALRQGVHPVGNVLRAEATFNNVADLRVYRPKEGDPGGELAWRVMRRGIADLHRRTEVSRKATERYLNALASVDDDTTLDELLRRLGQPTQWHGRRVRAFHPFDADDRVLARRRESWRVHPERVPEPGSAAPALRPPDHEPS